MTEGFPTKFGRYTLTERLAIGGMAELFLAEVAGAHGFAKTVVIKRILPHLAADQQFTAMFIAEAKITAILDHPKIAQTFELGTENDQLYIVMEYIDGLDVLALLRECAHRRVRLPAEIAVHIIKEVLDALDFAHGQTGEDGEPLGIVHRDVSPSNILLSRRGDVKLVDFGIAHAYSSETGKTQAGTLKGKYGYMSPEQVLGSGLDHRSDIFSVGVVLAEMLMGRRLFAAPNELDVLLMVRDVKLDRLDRFGKGIEPALENLVRWALRKDPSDRFKDAASFRDALDEWLFESRKRVTARNVAEVVEALYADVQKRRAEQVSQEPPAQAQGTPKAAWQAEARAAAGGGGAPEPAPPAAAPPKRRKSESLATGSDAHNLDDLVIEEVADPAARAGGGHRRGLADADHIAAGSGIHLDPGTDIEIVLDDIFPADQGPEEDDGVPELSDGGTYPSISAAVASVSPQERDPASRDFDDTDVSGVRPGGSRRLPTAEELAQAQGKRPKPPAPEEIDDSPARSGELDAEPPLEILWRLTSERATGLLVVSVGGTRKEIYLRRGVPEYVASNVAGELFGAYLVREGAISSSELDMALAVIPHFGGKLGDTLVGLGLMKPLEVFRHLTRQVRQKLIDVCTWTSGRYTWYPGRQNPRTAFPLDLDPLEVYGAGAAALPREAIDEWLMFRGNLRPKARHSAAVVPELFQLGSITRRIQESLDGRRSLHEIAEQIQDPQQRLETLRVVYLLMCTQLAVDVA